MVQILPSGLMAFGVRWKAIFEPSGDHAGCLSLTSGLLEMLISSVPIGVIVKICATPPTTLLKAILVPSGDHAGSVSGFEQQVTPFGFVPSLFITQMSPVASFLKAIRP